LIVGAVVHEEATGLPSLEQQDGNHEDDVRPQVGAEPLPYGHRMQPLSLMVEVLLYVSALEVVLQDSFLYFS
jgi:hypothetical protein